MVILIAVFSAASVVKAEGLIDVAAIHKEALSIIDYYQDAGYKAAYHNMQPVYVPNYGEDGEIEERDGYAIAVSDVRDGKVNWTAYLDKGYELIHEGLAVEKYEYDDEGKLSLLCSLCKIVFVSRLAFQHVVRYNNHV